MFIAEADPSQPPPLAKPALRQRAAAAERAEAAVAILDEEIPAATEPLPDAPTRPTKPFKAVPFAVLFTRDPDRLFKGRAEADLSLDGLRVRLRNRRDLWVSVCSAHPARYVGGNRVVVFLDGREVTLTLVKARTDLNKLARDVAAFLNGGRAELKSRDYRLPWKLTLVPWLALAVPCLAIWTGTLGGVHGGGRFLWFFIAGIAVLVGVKTMRREALSTGRRVAAAGITVGFCFFLLGGAFAFRLAYPTTVPTSDWRPFTPMATGGTGCRVLMPGMPSTLGQTMVAGVNNTSVYTVNYYALDKTFELTVGTINRAQIVGGENDNFVLQDRRRMLENEVLSFGAGATNRVVTKAGAHGLQVVMKVPPFRGVRGHHDTMVSRLFVSGDQLFTLSVSGEYVDADDLDAKKFFDSLDFLPAAVVLSPSELPGVIAHWSFEEIAPNNADAFYFNVSLCEGVRGRAASMRGNSYVGFDARPNLDFKAKRPFSCVGWMRANPGPTPCLVSMNGSGAMKLEFYVENGRLEVELNTQTWDNDLSVGKLDGPMVHDGVWHHFALTRSDSGSDVTLYVDGRVADFQSDPRLAGALRTTVRTLGCRRTAVPSFEAYLNGALDEVAFFDRCLSEAEIASLARTAAP
jgi:hypothetical protein